MRIVHITRTLDPAAGGLQVYPVRLAAAQAALGHEVWLASERDGSAVDGTPPAFEGVPGADRVRVGWVTPSDAWAMLGLGAAWYQCRDLISGADICHIHGLWEPVLWVAAKVARSAQVPYLVAPHGMLDPWALGQKKWKKWLGMLVGWRSILNRAAGVHCLNVDEERLIADLGLRSPPVRIGNGIFLDEVDPLPPADEFAACRSELSGHPYILFLSRLHYKKGLDILAAAFREVAAIEPRVHLVVAGPDGGAKGEFEQLIEAAGLGERVHIVGRISVRDKWAALAGAACFCLPSRQEGFSSAILEALAARVPVVISDACHFPEVAEVGAGEVVSLAADNVAAALRRILASDDLRRQMGAAGRNMVEERFTWRMTAERSLRVYEQSLSGR
ncbi:MAG: glycosyltransferase [Gemmataceae bacterium]